MACEHSEYDCRDCTNAEIASLNDAYQKSVERAAKLTRQVEALERENERGRGRAVRRQRGPTRRLQVISS